MIENENRRALFHEHKKPAVCFSLDDQLHSGQVTDVSDEDMTIVLDAPIRAEAGQRISALFLGGIEDERRLEDLHIGRVRHSEELDKWTLRVTVKDTQQVQKFRSLIGGRSSTGRTKASTDTDPTRLPKIRAAQHYTQEGVNARMSWLRDVSGEELPNLEKHAFRPESLAGNIENFVGAVQDSRRNCGTH